MLATGTLKIPGVRGIVSFAGGMKASDCPNSDAALIRAAGELGARTRLPSIWFFGDNDALFATPVWHAMHSHYVAAGGSAELVAYGRFGENSHNMLGFAKAQPLWEPKVDAFLARIGMPAALVHPEYLPMLPPLPSHYADLHDIGAVPWLGAQGEANYRKFLDSPLPRAFAIGPHGAVAASGGYDPLSLALRLCSQNGQECLLYAVDNDVVWTRPAPSIPATNFARLDDVDAVPYLNVKGREGYRAFLKSRRPRAFVIAPDGAWSAGSLGDDPVARVLAVCREHHQDCRLYAVDGDVVWPEATDGVRP